MGCRGHIAAASSANARCSWRDSSGPPIATAPGQTVEVQLVVDVTNPGRGVTGRNALRSDSALAERYAKLNRDRAARYGDDREAYTDAKRAFVQTVINNRKDGFGVGE